MQVGLGFYACHVTFWCRGRLRKSLLSHVCTEAYLACAVVKLLARYVLPCAVFVFVVVFFCCCFERLAQPYKKRAAMESHEAMPLQKVMSPAQGPASGIPNAGMTLGASDYHS